MLGRSRGESVLSHVSPLLYLILGCMEFGTDDECRSLLSKFFCDGLISF
jgi:hypothetical protein